MSWFWIGAIAVAAVIISVFFVCVFKMDRMAAETLKECWFTLQEELEKLGLVIHRYESWYLILEKGDPLLKTGASGDLIERIQTHGVCAFSVMTIIKKWRGEGGMTKTDILKKAVRK